MESFRLDRASILERLGGDEEIYDMLVSMFVGDVGNNCEALLAAFAAGDAPAVSREAHTVKGLLATFSDEVGAAAAQVVEKQARDGDIADLGEPVTALARRLREVAAVLEG